MSRRHKGAVRCGVLVLTTGLLAACGSAEPDPSAAGGTGGRPNAERSASAQGDTVAAVSASATPGPVDVRFALSTRPLVGQPVDVDVSLTPTQELDRLYVRFQAPEGLQLLRGAETPSFPRPAVGTRLSHTVTVIPQADGIFSITASVVTDSPTGSITRSYSIPLISGEGVADAPAAPASPTP